MNLSRVLPEVLRERLTEGLRDGMRGFRAMQALKLALSFVLVGACLWVTQHVFFLLNDRFLHGPVEFDEAHFMWGGWCITKGLAPYRDFLEFKPPFVFLTHALAMKLYGYHEFGYRKFFAFFPLASIFALQISMMTRGIDKLLSLGLVLGLIALWVNPTYHDVALSDSESIGLTFYFLAVAFLIVKVPGVLSGPVAARARDYSNAIGGAFLFACIQSKEPFLACALFTWVACFLMGERTSNAREDLWRYFKWTAIGAGLVLLALCIYMVPTGSMREYLAMLHGYFRFYRDPSQSYCVVLGRVQPTTPMNDLVLQFEKARHDFLNRTTLGYLVPYGVASLAFLARKSPFLLATAAAASFFALHAVTASNCQWVHYYNMTMSGVFFYFIAGIDAMQSHLRAADPYTRNFVRFALLGVILVQVWPRIEAEEEVYGTRKYPNEFSEPVPGIFEVISKYTLPEDRIFTTGMPALYVQANRISAIRESAIVDETLGYYDGTTDQEKLSGLRAQLEKNRPKVVILDPWLAPRKVRTNGALMYPFLAANGYKRLNEGSDVVWLRPDVAP